MTLGNSGVDLVPRLSDRGDNDGEMTSRVSKPDLTRHDLIDYCSNTTFLAAATPFALILRK